MWQTFRKITIILYYSFLKASEKHFVQITDDQILKKSLQLVENEIGVVHTRRFTYKVLSSTQWNRGASTFYCFTRFVSNLFICFLDILYVTYYQQFQIYFVVVPILSSLTFSHKNRWKRCHSKYFHFYLPNQVPARFVI